MRIFKNIWFEKFARKERLSDHVLIDAIARAEKGLVDADLGGGLIKQRVAREGAGRSGGYRTIVIFRSGTRAVFVFGFAKSDRANLSQLDEALLKKAARNLLYFSESEMDDEVSAGSLKEIWRDDQDL